MNDPQVIIDSIRRTIETPESVSMDKQSTYASEYAQSCNDINRRLEQCSRYLRAGNPCEAIRLAETTPHLLDLCNIMDFPEREDWNEICKSQGLEVAAALNQTVIESLNDAYNVVYQSEVLFKEHRRLALAHAPLKNRLAVLYKLADNEPENIMWSDMIGKYETARIEEINNEFALARAERNLGRVIPELLRELESAIWKTPPPAALIESMRTLASQAVVKQNLQQFRVLADNFHHAASDGDIPRARHWQEQWNARLKTSKIALASIPEEIRNIYNSSARWLVQLEQKNKIASTLKAKIVDLERAIKVENDPDELAEIHRNLVDFAQRHSVDYPSALTTAFREKYSRLKSDKMRLQLLMILGIVVAAILILLLIVQAIRVVLGSSQVNVSAGKVSLFLKNYREYDPGKPDSLDALEKAEKELQRLKAEMPKSSQYQVVINLTKSLEEAKADNITRQGQFAKALARAEMLMASESQDNKDLDGTAVEEAKKLVRTTEENVKWQHVREKYVDLGERNRRREEHALQNEISRLETRAMDLEEEDFFSEEKALAEMESIRKGFENLASAERSFPFPPEAKEKMEARLRKIEEKLVQQRKVLEDLNELSSAVGIRTSYATTLQKFENKYPDSSFVRDFSKVRAELYEEANVAAWNMFAAASRSIWFGFANFPTVSRRFHEEFEAKVSQFSFIPEVSELSSFLSRLQPLLENGGRQKICEQLEKYFSYEKKTLYVNRHEKDGNFFYDYYHLNGKERVPWRKEGNSDPISKLGSNEVNQLPEAPHQVAFSDSLARLRPLLSSNYYTVAQWYTMAGRILHAFDPKSNDKMDPYVKVIHLKAILAILKVDPIINLHFNDWLNRLNHAALDIRVDWSNPELKSLAAQRKLAEDILQSLDPLQVRLEAVFQDVKLLQSPILVNYIWIGYLRKYENWQCVTVHPGAVPWRAPETVPWRAPGTVPGRAPETVPSGDLFVYRHTDGLPTRFLHIGRLTRWEAAVIVSSDELLQGQPVFLKRVALAPGWR